MAARRLELPRNAAESAVRSIGLGYDVAADVRLKFCKQRGEPLIELDRDGVQDIVLPGSLTVAGVPKSIKCDKGERMRFRSDVLSFQQVCFLPVLGVIRLDIWKKLWDCRLFTSLLAGCIFCLQPVIFF
jgi:hypothetical protein